MRKRMQMFALGLIGLVITGCGVANTTEPTADHHHPKENVVVSTDIREETKSPNELPTFLKNVDPSIKKIYLDVAANQSLLDWIPCYCGCGQSVGHKSNRECFIFERKPNGQMVWDSHGVNCGTCLTIAAEAIALQKQNHSTEEIRQLIDQQYKNGYATPTPTPMP